MSEVRRVSALRVAVSKETLSRVLRFREGTTTLDGRVEGLVDDAVREGRSLLESEAVYRNVGLEASGGEGIVIDGGRLRLPGSALARHLEGLSRGTILAVTVGEGISARVRALSAGGEMTRAAVMDAFGSEAVEALADLLTAQIASEARRADCSLTSRFSPGYGDLPLDSQRDLLEYVEAHRIGISLSETMAMAPEKSISAILGWKETTR